MPIRKNKKLIEIEIEDGKTKCFKVNLCWQSPVVISLCSNCAMPYFDNPDRKIIRIDPYQYIYERCDICGAEKGYDFVIFERALSRAAV